MSASDHLNPMQFRWMHYKEYEQAQEEGHFRNGINSSAGVPDHRYMAGDHVLVRFRGSDLWHSKMDPLHPAYHYARGEPPFSDAEVLQANPLVPERIAGPRPKRGPKGWEMAQRVPDTPR